jgi:glycosyltransferase involved in cell wall biosynthesis
VVRIPRVRLLEPIPIGPSWRKLLLDVLMFLWTVGLLLRHSYQAVDAHEESVFWCRFLKPLFGFKLIYDMHSSLPQQLVNFKFTQSRLLIGTFKLLEDVSLHAADVVISVCPDLHRYAAESGVPAERVVLVENSLFDEVRVRLPGDEGAPGDRHPRVDFGPGHPVILYAGTFEVYQGVDLLIRAFAKVLAQRPEARLLLVGGNAEQVQTMRGLATELGLGDRCVLTGHVVRNVASEYTKRATVLVSPRIYGTNTPLKIYEQLASGHPLVATRIWSHTQVLDDTVCRLVEPTAEALAEGLVATLEDPADAATRAKCAMELYRCRYSRPIYEQKIRRVFELIS